MALLATIGLMSAAVGIFYMLFDRNYSDRTETILMILIYGGLLVFGFALMVIGLEAIARELSEFQH